MSSNLFTILILYFCCSTIYGEFSSTPSLFPHTNNSSGSKLYCLGGQDEKGEISFSVSQLVPSSNQWKRVTEMTTPRYMFGATAIGKKIYVSGGWTGREYLNLLEVFDIENNIWTELAPLPHVRDDHGMTSLNGDIYVAGGRYEGDAVYSSVLKYSLGTDTWTEVKALNQKRYYFELVTLNGAIYAIAGVDTNTVERYSPLIDKWSFVTPTHHNHSTFGAASHQDKIYVLSQAGFEVFIPEADTWKELPSLNVGNGVQLASLDDNLLAIGGSEGTNQGKTVYEFDTTNNSWNHRSDMDVARYFHRAVVVNF